MKRVVLAVLIALLATPLFAQEATLDTPQSVTKLRVAEVTISREGGGVRVEFLTGSGNVRRAIGVGVGQDELVSFITAIGTPRANETGGAGRRFQYRVLGWLVDNNKLRDEDGVLTPVTLVP